MEYKPNSSLSDPIPIQSIDIQEYIDVLRTCVIQEDLGGNPFNWRHY